MRPCRISMKKQQPSINKLRKFIKDRLDQEEFELFDYSDCSSDEYVEYYYTNDRTKCLMLEYDYYLVGIRFKVKGRVILDTYSFEYECSLESLITEEMRAVMHEHECRRGSQHIKFNKSKRAIEDSFIKEVMQYEGFNF